MTPERQRSLGDPAEGLRARQRGGKNDIKAVLALVVDQDADVGKDGITDLLMLAPYTVASFGARRQLAYILNRALTARGAADRCGGDAGTRTLPRLAHRWHPGIG